MKIAVTPYRKLHDYEEALRRAGAEPIVVDMLRERPGELLKRIDGVLLPGGGDVDPARYGEPRHPTFDPAEEGRDEYEIELVERALDADTPVLAICRGIQVLNVARDGSLVQDVPDQVPSAGQHRVTDSTFAIAHDIWVTTGSRLEDLIKDRLEGETCAVNSRHHQAVKSVGDGLVVSATAPDGVIEALEDPSRRFCVGVQWHPENFYRTGEFSGLFDGLVAACARRR